MKTLQIKDLNIASNPPGVEGTLIEIIWNDDKATTHIVPKNRGLYRGIAETIQVGVNMRLRQLPEFQELAAVEGGDPNEL
jgi:hypothetical protein